MLFTKQEAKQIHDPSRENKKKKLKKKSKLTTTEENGGLQTDWNIFKQCPPIIKGGPAKLLKFTDKCGAAMILESIG